MDITKLPIEMLPTKSITVMGTNRHEPSDNIPLDGMVSSMKAHGLLQPIIVYRDGSKLECVAGARRLAAAKALKWKEIPAKVIVAATGITEELLREIRLVENLQRADLSPFEEAEQLAVLVDTYPKPPKLEDLANKLGKSTTWVAQRQAINKLAEPLRKIVQEQRWPLGHIVELAREPVDNQHMIANRIDDDDFFPQLDSNEPYIPTLGELRDFLSRFHRNLSSAPWDPSDAQLMRSAGACTVCPMRSLAQPMLFPEAVETDVDQCLNEECWKAKEQAVIQVQLDKLKKKKLQPVIIANTGSSFRSADGVIVMTWNNLQPAKQTDSGSIPAVMATPNEFGKVQWVKPWKPEKNTKPVDQDTGKAPVKPKPKPEELTQEEQITQVTMKRMLAAINYWKDDTLPQFEPDLGLVMALVASFGTAPVSEFSRNWEVFEGASQKLPAALAKDVYEEVYPVLQKRFTAEEHNATVITELWVELHQQAKAFNDRKALEYCWGESLKDHKWPKHLAGVDDPNKAGEVPGEDGVIG